MAEKEEIGIKLCVDRTQSISRGSFGASFMGTFEGEPVMIKRYEKEKFDVDLKVIRQVKNHQNVLHYYCSEENVDFMSVFLLC